MKDIEDKERVMRDKELYEGKTQSENMKKIPDFIPMKEIKEISDNEIQGFSSEEDKN